MFALDRKILFENEKREIIGRNAKTEVEYWKLFFTDQMLQEIILYTNKEIKLKRDACQNSNTQKFIMNDVSLIEMRAFIGLLYLSGYFKSNRQNLKDLRRSDGTGIEIFRTTMTLKRFQLIQNCVRMDDKITRAERKKLLTHRIDI